MATLKSVFLTDILTSIFSFTYFGKRIVLCHHCKAVVLDPAVDNQKRRIFCDVECYRKSSEEDFRVYLSRFDKRMKNRLDGMKYMETYAALSPFDESVKHVLMDVPWEEQQAPWMCQDCDGTVWDGWDWDGLGWESWRWDDQGWKDLMSWEGNWEYDHEA